MLYLLVFSSLCLCCLTVFADVDEVKSVSVTEGDSISLESGQTELQEEDVITWEFGHSKTGIACIALINKEAESFSTSEGDAVGFRDRLKLDHQTGSLNITNTRTTDSGLYQVNFNSGQNIRRFRVTVYAFADADAVKSVSVMEGDSVSLESGQTKIQEEDVIVWTFGLSETRIALINKEAEVFSTSEGDAVGFRDRLKLDHQTGSLTITNTRTTDSGLYQVNFNSGQTTNRFKVTVQGYSYKNTSFCVQKNPKIT